MQLAPYYAAYPLRQHQLDFTSRLAVRNRLRLLKRHGLRRSHRLLDYGCGTGVFLAYLREQGYDAAGYDAYVSDYADASVLARQYDFVTSFDVIEHASDPRAFMRVLSSLTAPSGALVINTPDAAHLCIRDPARLPVDISQPYHRHILSEPVLLQLGAEQGFAPHAVYRRYCGDTWFPGVNTRFAWNYIHATGGMLDALTEPLQWPALLRNPGLLFDALFGSLVPQRGNLFVVFRRPGHSA